MQRCFAHGLEMMPHKRPRNRAKGNRRIVGTECGGTHLIHRTTRGFRQNGNGIHIAELALVGRHPRRCVPLGQLNIAVTFLRREWQVLRGRVILVINKSLAR